MVGAKFLIAAVTGEHQAMKQRTRCDRRFDAEKAGKRLNGIFRSWLRFGQDDQSVPIIWGHCIVHLSHPEFSGNVLHTSRVIGITDIGAFKIVETQNNFYALLGPELIPAIDQQCDPTRYILENGIPPAAIDTHISAALTADPACPKCHGSGVYYISERTIAVCDRCCKHNQGWWQLESVYGADNGRWACKAGCGAVVNTPPPELEFLPRALQ